MKVAFRIMFLSSFFCLMYGMRNESHNFLLNEQNVQLLCQGVNNYVSIMEKIEEEDMAYKDNSALIAYREMASRIEDFKTPEQMVQLIQQKDTESHFEAICNYYYK